MSVLKPCPFCGKMPKVDTSQWKHFEHQYEPIIVVEQRVKIDCDDCFLHMDIVSYGLAAIGTKEDNLKAIADKCAENVVNEVWNRRAE